MPCGTRRWNGVVGTGRGNTERAGTRRPSEGRWDGVGRARPLEGDYAFCMRLSVCEYVYVREYGLRARASTYESTESRRVSSIDEEGNGRSRAEFDVELLSLSLFLYSSFSFFYFYDFSTTSRFFLLLFFFVAARSYLRCHLCLRVERVGFLTEATRDDHARLERRSSLCDSVAMMKRRFVTSVANRGARFVHRLSLEWTVCVFFFLFCFLAFVFR